MTETINARGHVVTDDTSAQYQRQTPTDPENAAYQTLLEAEPPMPRIPASRTAEVDAMEDEAVAALDAWNDAVEELRNRRLLADPAVTIEARIRGGDKKVTLEAIIREKVEYSDAERAAHAKAAAATDKIKKYIKAHRDELRDLAEAHAEEAAGAYLKADRAIRRARDAYRAAVREVGVLAQASAQGAYGAIQPLTAHGPIDSTTVPAADANNVVTRVRARIEGLDERHRTGRKQRTPEQAAADNAAYLAELRADRAATP